MIWTLTTATLAASTGASAQAAAEAALSEQLEQQEQRIRVLERKLEIQEDAAKTAASSTPVVKASPKGFALQSADAANQIKLRGVVHIDGRYLVNDAGFAATDRTGGTDTWQLTRVRPIIEGTLSNLIDFRFTPDFGQGRTVIQDAFVTARFAPVLRVTAGKFKAPFGLERLQSANDIRFVARAYPTSLSPNRDIGLALEGDLFDGRLSYAAAYANGVIDGGSSEATADVDVDDDQDLIVRLFSHPFAALDAFALRGLGFGIAASYIEQVGTVAQPLLPSFRTPPQQTFFRYRTGATATISNGERFRWSPQFYYYVGSLGLLGEYVHVSTDVARTTTAGTHTGKIDNAAWQFAASWFLTGEEAANRGYTPLSTFNPGVSLGAFELTARYHELDIDDDAFVGGTDSFADPNLSASKASTAEVGINWYVNQNLKWVLNYGITRFEGGVPTGDRDDEKFLLMRFALGF
jgi:phosphate-selective porin OprO/OprP